MDGLMFVPPLQKDKNNRHAQSSHLPKINFIGSSGWSLKAVLNLCEPCGNICAEGGEREGGGEG